MAMHTGNRLVVGLWSTPRSVSTAFERAFLQRPDTDVVHEPFTDCYYFSRYRRQSRYGDYEHLWEYGPDQAISKIMHNERPLIFFKELAFQAIHYVNPPFLSTIKNTFLIRSPIEVIASLSRLKPDFTEEELGFSALRQLYSIITEELGQETMVIDANQFRTDPQATLEKYCEFLGIPFYKDMLKWKAGTFLKWQAHEAESQRKWHSEVEQSTHILPPEDKPFTIKMEHEHLLKKSMQIYEELLQLTREPVHLGKTLLKI